LGENGSGQMQTVLPEPATLALLGSSLLAFGFVVIKPANLMIVKRITAVEIPVISVMNTRKKSLRAVTRM